VDQQHIREFISFNPIDNGTLSWHDRLFHILDVVDLDQHWKFVKLQCPGARWRGSFSGFEERTRHWANEIHVILEIGLETAPTAGWFWMICEDLIQNLNCIIAFSPVSSFVANLKRARVRLGRESQFYVPPPLVSSAAQAQGTRRSARRHW
jgi:hypothetical protein